MNATKIIFYLNYNNQSLYEGKTPTSGANAYEEDEYDYAYYYNAVSHESEVGPTNQLVETYKRS